MSRAGARRIDLVVVLHGVGARGADLAPIARAWARRLTGVRFVTPDAPFPFDEDASLRQWYSLVGVTPENRAGRVAAAAAAFDAVVDGEIARAGTTAARTLLVGFSQGGTMALDAIGRGRDFAGLLAMSTRLAAPPARRLDGFPVRIVHGEADGAIPIAEATRIRDILAAAGARVDFIPVPGCDHTIDFAAAKAGLTFLRDMAEGPAVA
jgi:phospholipase/carboxylesterase